MTYMTFDELVNWAYEAKFISKKDKKEFNEINSINLIISNELKNEFIILKQEIAYMNSIMYP